MLSSPHIPSECPLLEEIEVGLICHMVTYLLFVIIILHRKENTYQRGWNEGYITLPFHFFQIISAAIPKQITSPHPPSPRQYTSYSSSSNSFNNCISSLLLKSNRANKSG